MNVPDVFAGIVRAAGVKMGRRALVGQFVTEGRDGYIDHAERVNFDRSKRYPR